MTSFYSFSGISQWQYTETDSESKNKILLYRERTSSNRYHYNRNLLTTFSTSAHCCYVITEARMLDFLQFSMEEETP
jgi:hypothetical protein